MMDGIPEHITRVAEVMAPFEGDWFIAGGWAADAWLGRQTRKHGDMDVVIFKEDQRAIFEHLQGWTMVPHAANFSDTNEEMWDGREVDVPGHVHVPADPLIENGVVSSKDGFNIELTMNERDLGEWILTREPPVSIPMHMAVGRSVWGVPVAVPEVLVYFKAKDMRRRDERDFRNLLPLLTYEARRWVYDADRKSVV